MICCYDSNEIKNCTQDNGTGNPDTFQQSSRTARIIFRYLEEHISFKKALILCSRQTRDTDWIALSGVLAQNGRKCDVYLCAGNVQYFDRKDLSEDVCLFFTLPDNSDYDLIIDWLSGENTMECSSEALDQAIHAINSIKGRVISIDIPAGVNADTGTVEKNAIKADLTLVLSFYRPGHFLYPGVEYSGKTVLLETGLKMSGKEKYRVFTSMPPLPPRSSRSNKGSYGTVAVVAGCKNMAGAAILAAKSAYFAGAGLVKIFTVEENREIIQSALPEAVLYTYTNTTPVEDLILEVSRCSALVLGPGMGQLRKTANIVKELLKNISIPILCDADGLNVACEKRWLEQCSAPLVITPHPGEASRLINISIPEILSSVRTTAEALSDRFHCVTLLKDAHTVITDGNTGYINITGNNGMSTGGSGDVLAGIIGCFLAQGCSPLEAAATGAYVHGLAGDLAAKKYGKRSLIASHIIEHIAEVLKDC